MSAALFADDNEPEGAALVKDGEGWRVGLTDDDLPVSWVGIGHGESNGCLSGYFYDLTSAASEVATFTKAEADTMADRLDEAYVRRGGCYHRDGYGTLIERVPT